MQLTLQYKNGNLSYTKSGSGPAVVLLHGFGEDSSIWDKQVSDWQADFLIITPDLPGTGKSDLLQASEGKPVSMEDYADCIFALAKHEKLEKFILFGHSMGGYVAMAYAEKYSATLSGFGLLHSTAFADSAEKKEARLKGIKLIEQYGGYSFLKNTIPTLFADAFKSEHADEITGLIEKGAAFSKEALIQYYEAMMNRPDRTHVLEHLDVPALFIIGDKDVAVPLADLMQQVHLPSISYIHILKGIGHMGMWEAAGEFVNYLKSYLYDLKIFQS